MELPRDRAIKAFLVTGAIGQRNVVKKLVVFVINGAIETQALCRDFVFSTDGHRVVFENGLVATHCGYIVGHHVLGCGQRL